MRLDGPFWLDCLAIGLGLHVLGGPWEVNNFPQQGPHITTQVGHGLQLDDVCYGLAMRTLAGYALMHMCHDALAKNYRAVDCPRSENSTTNISLDNSHGE